MLEYVQKTQLNSFVDWIICHAAPCPGVFSVVMLFQAVDTLPVLGKQKEHTRFVDVGL